MSSSPCCRCRVQGETEFGSGFAQVNVTQWCGAGVPNRTFESRASGIRRHLDEPEAGSMRQGYRQTERDHREQRCACAWLPHAVPRRSADQVLGDALCPFWRYSAAIAGNVYGGMNQGRATAFVQALGLRRRLPVVLPADRGLDSAGTAQVIGKVAYAGLAAGTAILSVQRKASRSGRINATPMAPPIIRTQPQIVKPV